MKLGHSVEKMCYEPRAILNGLRRYICGCYAVIQESGEYYII